MKRLPASRFTEILINVGAVLGIIVGPIMIFICLLLIFSIPFVVVWKFWEWVL